MGVPDVKPTGSELRRRLNLVERAMNERGWSTELARALAKQMGVGVRSVYRYRMQVLEDIHEAITVENPEMERAEFLDRMRRYQTIARDSGALGALSSMLNCESKVLGLERPQAVEVTHRLANGPLVDAGDDEMEWVLAVLARSRDGLLTGPERDALALLKAGAMRQLAGPDEIEAEWAEVE
jgi:hypothetical protein